MILILSFRLQSFGISRFLIFPRCFVRPSVGLPSASSFLSGLTHLLLPPLVECWRFPPLGTVERSVVFPIGRLVVTVGRLSVKLIVMVKRSSSAFSAAAVARSGLALGRTVEKTLALEAEVSRLRHHISVLSRRLHFSSLESESRRRELDALRSVAPLSREGDGAEASPLREEVADEVAVLAPVADEVAVLAPVAEPAAPTLASLGVHVEALTVTTVASAVMA